jgi:HK97 family phage major capsid protein
MKTLQALRDDLAACLADIDGLAAVSKERELTDDESTKFDALLKQSQDLTASCDKAEAAEKAVADAREKLAYLNKPQRMAHSGQPTNLPKASPHFMGDAQPALEFPAPRANTPQLSKLAHYTAEQRTKFAYNFGRFAMALRGHGPSQRYCIENGISLEATAQTEGNNFNGGYLVPDQFENTMIDLRLMYGIFRQYAENVPMSSETLTRPRRKTGLTAYFVNEDAAITESNMTWDRVGLVAKDLYVISRMTNQLSDDAVINIGDTLAGEMAYAFAYKEDLCGFNGDGTSTYGGIVGLKTKVTASTSGLVTGASGTHTNWAGVTLANFNSMVGLLPTYARTPNTKWYCSPAFYGGVIQRVEYAAGGNSAANLAAGAPPSFLGYPVVVSEVLVSSAAAAEVVCYLGDLGQAAMFGNRRGTSIAFSDSAVINSVSMFERNETAVRAWERFDINVHSPDTTAAGSVIGLLTAS